MGGKKGAFVLCTRQLTSSIVQQQVGEDQNLFMFWAARENFGNYGTSNAVSWNVAV